MKINRPHRVAKALSRFQPRPKKEPMKAAPTPLLSGSTSRPRSGFMAVLTESTVKYLAAELGPTVQAVIVKVNPMHEHGKSIAVDLAFFTDTSVPGSRAVSKYRTEHRPGQHAVQFSRELSDGVVQATGDRLWSITEARVERLSNSYDGYDALKQRSPGAAQALATTKKVVALRFITAYGQMAKPISINRVNAASSAFTQVKARTPVADAIAPAIPTIPTPAPTKPVVLNSPPIVREVVDGRIDMAVAISVNGVVQRENVFRNLTALQLADMMVYMQGKFA